MTINFVPYKTESTYNQNTPVNFGNKEKNDQMNLMLKLSVF